MALIHVAQTKRGYRLSKLKVVEAYDCPDYIAFSRILYRLDHNIKSFVVQVS